MKIALVTGSTGFLGRHLVKRLKSDGWSVYISNTSVYNLNDYNNLINLNSIKFSHIFHLAANTKAGDWCKYHKGEQWLTNQTLNTNILKYWYEHQPQAKMITFGTSCSYGPSELPMPESDYLLYEPDKDLYTYAMTKRMLYVGCKSLSEQYGLKYTYYVPSTIYGPDFDLSDSHFIFDLIKKIVIAKRTGSAVELWGDGNQKRELIYIEDLIEAVLNTVHLNNEIINIGSGVDYSIREYAGVICDLVNYPKNNILYDENKFVGVNRKILSIYKLINLLPDNFTFTKIEEGINKTTNYFITKI